MLSVIQQCQLPHHIKQIAPAKRLDDVPRDIPIYKAARQDHAVDNEEEGMKAADRYVLSADQKDFLKRAKDDNLECVYLQENPKNEGRWR